MHFKGCNTMTREAWPKVWLPITYLKPDLRRTARAMWDALRPPPQPPGQGTVRGVKRDWSGLGWDGADEGGRRCSQRLAAGQEQVEASVVAARAAAAWGVVLRPVAAAPEGMAVGTATVIEHAAAPWGVVLRPVAQVPAGMATAQAAVIADADWGGGVSGTGR